MWHFVAAPFQPCILLSAGLSWVPSLACKYRTDLKDLEFDPAHSRKSYLHPSNELFSLLGSEAWKKSPLIVSVVFK
jgi:hypothetical protein